MVNYTVRVKVSNDTDGALGAMLRASNLTCRLNEWNATAAVSADEIVCQISHNASDHSATPRSRPSSILYFSVAANGVPLQFDRIRDHYIIMYHNPCHANGTKPAHCASCFWDDDQYRYYCKWCSRDDRCSGTYQHCDVRRLSDLSRVTPVATVRVKCPAAHVQSIEPAYGPWAGGTTMRIAVSNHEILSENRLTRVTVAGRRCLLPTKVVGGGGTLKCTITTTNATDLDEGPVEVTYVTEDESLPNLTLQSDETFYFVDPEITSMRPTCGPTKGGTVLNIRGNFLDAGSAVRVFINENITCAVKSHGQNDVSCVTGPSDGPAAGLVKLEFDGYLSKYVHSPVFHYTGEPTVAAGQRFSGIASGGTRLPVRGRYFTCIENPFVYVSYNGIRHTGACQVTNDTYMECRSPKVNRPAPRTATALPFGFQADFDKKILLLEPPGESDYELFPDPVVTDFDTDGRTVTINGHHLDQGYPADDLSVQFPGHQVPWCNVTLVSAQQIVCLQSRPSPERSSPPSTPLVDGHGDDTILVSVGVNIAYEVKKKPTAHYSSPLKLTIFLSVVTLVSLVISFVGVIVYCLKVMITASGQQTEMQSLCENLSSSNSSGNINNNANDPGPAVTAAEQDEDDKRL